MASNRSMPGVFISYRRDDSSPYAGRLYDHVSARFGAQRVFMDIDTIRPGEDFVQVISDRVAGCDSLIAIIGRNWLSCRDSHGRRRLDDPNDFVLIEIASALQRNVRVIPALVDGALIPARKTFHQILRLSPGAMRSKSIMPCSARASNG